MTALDKYIRLEAEGQWRAHPDAEPIAVIVSFGDATLVFSGSSDAPLGHWSLAAVRVLDEADGRTSYAPDADGSETLEIADRDMVEAIGQITASLSKPRKRRLPLFPLISAGALVIALGAGLIWGPGMLRTHAYSLIPQEHAALWASAIRPRIPGESCQSLAGVEDFHALLARLAKDRQGAVTVHPLAGAKIAALPNGHVLLDSATFSAAASPTEAAAWIALAVELGPDESALKAHVEAMSLGEAVGFITTGEIREYELWDMVRRTVEEQTPVSADLAERAQGRLTTAKIATSAAVWESLGLTAPALDPDETFSPLSPSDWAALQTLCAER